MTTCLKAKDERIQIGFTGIIPIPVSVDSLSSQTIEASVYTWCGTTMVWDDHCKSRNEAARCHRYKGPHR